MRFVRLDEPQELSVPLSDLPGAVHTDVVAVVRPNLCHDTSLGPLFGIVPVLILDKDVISDLERMKKFRSPRKFVLHGELSVTVSLSSGICSLSPVLSEVKFAGLERERISDGSTEHNLGGAEAGDGAGVVPVDEESLDELVSVESPSLREIASDQSLGVLHSQLSSLVCPRIVSCGDSVNNSPL